MKIEEVVPNVETDVLLAGAQFADAFRIAIAGRTLDARQAAEHMMGRQPRWVQRLVALRNALVAPFGLKTSGAGEPATRGTIGIFPVLSETPDRLVAGFNDSHLDFRVVVDVSACAEGQQVTATTLVRTNNWLGRTYLAIILPFHRLVVRALLRQVAG
jgi:Protein of unknown function (DUF2867)